MHRNKTISVFIFLMIFSSCVTVYSPKIKGSDLNKYVVTGQVVMGSQLQTVNISQTTPISDQSYKPLPGCKVKIQDNEHHSFSMFDLGNGDYSTQVDPQYLVPGHVFRVNIVTPDGDSIISKYDTLQKVLPVDSIHYLIKDIKSSVPGQLLHGIQFYIDIKGNNTDSRYYRWRVYETWEYHAKYPLEFYYDGKMHHIFPPDSSKYTCWDTRKIPEIFTVSTSDLSQNKYDNLPLQFVSSNSSKLSSGYSMLVKQFALTKEAYHYWNQLRTNSIRNGGLNEKQPITIKGNLLDISHPNKEVLGFFSAESESSKRIFVSHVPGLTVNYVKPCREVVLKRGYIMIGKWQYPAPIKAGPLHHFPVPVLLSPDCVNCMLLGGTNVKPSFWPN